VSLVRPSANRNLEVGTSATTYLTDPRAETSVSIRLRIIEFQYHYVTMVKRKRVDSSPLGDRGEAHFDTVNIIDPNGDLNMIFSDNQIPSKKKMVVSRHVLCLSSKVFEAMLGDHSHFREATAPIISRDGVREAKFEDDDFDAMTIIMNVLHLQHQNVPKQMVFDQLHKIAILCDKYDLTRSMGLWPDTWAQQHVKQVGKKGFHGWLLIATVFRQGEAFTKMTKHIILNSTLNPDGDLLTAEGWTFDEGVPSTIISILARMQDVEALDLTFLR